jgi:hypothetical protein
MAISFKKEIRAESSTLIKMNIRTNHEIRLKAFDLLNELKSDNVPRKEIIDKIKTEFGIPFGTLYDWYRGTNYPYGRKGELKYNQELFYVLGALLGDGCVYRWKITHNHVILVGDRKFTLKYANMLMPCVGISVKPYIDRSKNIWFVKTNNFKLYSLFKKVRGDLSYLKQIIRQSGKNSSLLFVEGFFDAEGCVKIIKEKVRKTPKICLDFTNTDRELLEIVREILQDVLEIDAKYSIQNADISKNKKECYHLRIYKKEFVKRFFDNITTTKLKEEKIPYVKNWLNA